MRTTPSRLSQRDIFSCTFQNFMVYLKIKHRQSANENGRSGTRGSGTDHCGQQKKASVLSFCPFDHIYLLLDFQAFQTVELRQCSSEDTSLNKFRKEGA